MTREITSPDAPEAVPQDTAGFYEQRQKRLLASAAIFAGSLALLGTAGKADASPPMQRVGVVEPRFMYSSPEEAAALAAEIKASNFNSVRIEKDVIEGQDGNIEKNAGQFCIAAGAIAMAGLDLEITFRGRYPDGRLGWVPQNMFEINQEKNTLLAYEDLLGGPNACPQLSMLSPDAKIKYAFQISDEWNLAPFVADQKNAAVNFVEVHKAIYPALKQEAAKLGLDMEVWALGMTSAHDPYGTIQKIGLVMKKEGVKPSQLFDVVTHHPYEEFSTTSPAQKYGRGRSAIADYADFAEELKKDWGYTGPKVYDEFGVQTIPPPDKQYLYDGTQPEVNKATEAVQAKFYALALKIIACQAGNEGLYILHFVDNSNILEPWRGSGLTYPDGTPKSSLLSVSQAAKAARDGTIANCPAPNRLSARRTRQLSARQAPNPMLELIK